MVVDRRSRTLSPHQTQQVHTLTGSQDALSDTMGHADVLEIGTAKPMHTRLNWSTIIAESLLAGPSVTVKAPVRETRTRDTDTLREYIEARKGSLARRAVARACAEHLVRDFGVRRIYPVRTASGGRLGP